MQRRRLPERIFRAHANSDGPLDPSPVTGGWRFDDFRVPPHFHVIYTGDSVEGCFIEKFQRFRGSDDEAQRILTEIEHSNGDPIVIPSCNEIPAPLLRNLAASSLRVLDVTSEAVQIDALESVMEARTIGQRLGIDLPELKPGDVLHSDYDVSRRLSTIVFESQDVAGTASRSSLDDPSDTTCVHTNFNLFRQTPENGSELRVHLERVETYRALDHYVDELEAALMHLHAKPALPFDHPDLKTPT